MKKPSRKLDPKQCTDLQSVIRYAQSLEQKIDNLHRIIGRLEAERNDGRLGATDRARLDMY